MRRDGLLALRQQIESDYTIATELQLHCNSVAIQPVKKAPLPCFNELPQQYEELSQSTFVLR